MKRLGMTGLAVLAMAAVALPAVAAQEEPVTRLMMGTASHRGDTMTEAVPDLHERCPTLRISPSNGLLAGGRAALTVAVPDSVEVGRQIRLAGLSAGYL